MIHFLFSYGPFESFTQLVCSSEPSRRALFRGRPVVADFKYCITTKANTLAGNLEEGFRQAGTVVVKLENMDAGVFRDAIEYLKRKNFPCGNIKLINQYGDPLELTFTDFRNGRYLKKIKGFLK